MVKGGGMFGIWIVGFDFVKFWFFCDVFLLVLEVRYECYMVELLF